MYNKPVFYAILEVSTNLLAWEPTNNLAQKSKAVEVNCVLLFVIRISGTPKRHSSYIIFANVEWEVMRFMGIIFGHLEYESTYTKI